jgi:hypothetical protein
MRFAAVTRANDNLQIDVAQSIFNIFPNKKKNPPTKKHLGVVTQNVGSPNPLKVHEIALFNQFWGKNDKTDDFWPGVYIGKTLITFRCLRYITIPSGFLIYGKLSSYKIKFGTFLVISAFKI